MEQTLKKRGVLSAEKLAPVILLLIAGAFPLIANQPYYIQIAISILFYCFWSSSWNIIGGYAGQFAMGNGVYIGIGAYAAAMFYQEGGSPWLGTLVGALISVVFAFIISRPCFRLTGTYFSLATVAFLFIVRYVVLGFPTLFGVKTNGGVGMLVKFSGKFSDMQFASKTGYYYLMLVMLVIILLVSNKIRTSKMGYYLAAIKTNQGAAATIGVDVVKYKLTAQCICAFFMSLGGSFYVFFLYTVNPARVLSYGMSLEPMIYCVIGGLGTLWGPVVGAGVLGLLNEVLRVKFGSDVAPLAMAFYGVALALIVRFIPGGLWGLITRTKTRVVNKLAQKRPAGKEAK